MMLGKEPWRPSSNSDLACALMRAGFLQIFRFFSSHGKHVIYVSDVKEQSSWLCLELGCCCCCCFSLSVVSDSLRPHRLKPGGLLCPWDSPGKNTGVCCRFLLQGISPTRGSIQVSFSSCIVGGFFKAEPSGKPDFSSLQPPGLSNSWQSFCLRPGWSQENPDLPCPELPRLPRQKRREEKRQGVKDIPNA